ncbi:hypothetical protein M8818_005448 [Zalaria obscura]|uniref:Uncharacterized protein n=1 Tax=Zalaria obscura TaxID=2024903 RepID=A0ACC3S832_9PEZI
MSERFPLTGESKSGQTILVANMRREPQGLTQARHREKARRDRHSGEDVAKMPSHFRKRASARNYKVRPVPTCARTAIFTYKLNVSENTMTGSPKRQSPLVGMARLSMPCNARVLSPWRGCDISEP